MTAGACLLYALPNPCIAQSGKWREMEEQRSEGRRERREGYRERAFFLITSLNFTVGVYIPVQHLINALSLYGTHYCIEKNIQKKTPTYIFNYNSGISWSIFIIFVPVEREINTLQFTYLQSWCTHNCVTLHVTKVYFMELKMNSGRLYWKTPTFVWIITLAFLGRFLYFLN